MRLVLWDIDGTLVNTAGHGRDAFMEAFEAVVGRPPDHEDVPMAGRTDHAITLDLLGRNGVPGPEELLPRMFEELHTALLNRRELMAVEGAPQPGVPEALRALGARDDVLQSLLTGNIEPNAELKLAAFHLHSLVDLEIGGYGSDHGTRSELVGVARRKVREKHSMDVPLSDTVVVGDTPLDVDAARAAGARAVAVASGPYTAEELEQAAPDAVLDDVCDTRALLAALGLAR
jgi:phosphoglycolate phosphatase